MIAGLCIGVALGFLLSTPAVEDSRASQARVFVVLAFAVAGVVLL